MKKDIKNFVEENKDEVVFAIEYDKNKSMGRDFDTNLSVNLQI